MCDYSTKMWYNAEITWWGCNVKIITYHIIGCSELERCASLCYTNQKKRLLIKNMGKESKQHRNQAKFDLFKKLFFAPPEAPLVWWIHTYNVTICTVYGIESATLSYIHKTINKWIKLKLHCSFCINKCMWQHAHQIIFWICELL